MFAFIGLGLQEILILAVLAAMGIGAVVLIVVLTRVTGRPSDRQVALEEENRRLRDELDRQRERPA